METVLKLIPHDFPICERPYKEMADCMGISETDLLEALKDLREKGIVRRVAAVLFHRKASYSCNAMVVWKTDEEKREKIGTLMAAFPEVSHCYERSGGGYWDYSLYTMVHGRHLEECMDAVRRISEKVGIQEYKVFLSGREFKKTSLTVNIE
jgi:siroheme decarboxylase